MPGYYLMGVVQLYQAKLHVKMGTERISWGATLQRSLASRHFLARAADV